jgi:acetylornithine deacetylase/succinyl-diaminopimelate desuccinylase-like protein
MTPDSDPSLADLFALLRIPSISTDPAHAPDVARAATWLAGKLRALGFEADILATPRHPAVLAHYHAAPDLPTVLVYGHYDVQPADPVELWRGDPFEPVLEDGKIRARGASDDKGQVFAHIVGAEQLLRETGTLPVNLTFLIEGEEEIGSPNLAALIRDHRDSLQADVVLISDGAMVAPGLPTLTYGLKGLCYLELEVETAAMDLHSGAFGGGVPNAVHALARMIATLHDEEGRVAVPGFYDAVRDLSEAERAAFAAVPFDEADMRRETGVSATPGEAGYTLLERLWARPTLDVNGIGGGFQGAGAKTVIPAKARAKLSCRLVPDQTPEDIAEKLRAHLIRVAPAGARVAVQGLHGALPALTALDSPAVQLAAAALERAYGKPAVFARTGGTIPVVSTFQRELGTDVVLVGFGLETDRIHSPNETFDLAHYRAGVAASRALLGAFGSLPR